uniref:Rhophilin, Rho GTPase binding protein 1 n=1 Tax=Eptatretus burgeri TaxID=7764 RepID=A0A8C4NCC3_EPTBU
MEDETSPEMENEMLRMRLAEEQEKEQQEREQSYFRKGCDPFAQTQRSKLQTRRVRLNQQINKEMRLRTGAENLLRASSNHKVKETVSLELTYVNSNLQLLKEELSELNSSMEIYQNDSGDGLSIPLIPLGLKETKEVNFTIPLKEFIEGHYRDKGEAFDGAIKELMELRQAIRTPRRNQAGVELLMEYFNQLHFLDCRFYAMHNRPNIHFTWYDSLTGMPANQRDIALERASILFNVAALHTQIGAHYDRSTIVGLDAAIDAFLKAAGAFSYLLENFSHAPSLDMSPGSLVMLTRLMSAQVYECQFQKALVSGIRNEFEALLCVARDAASVSNAYLVTQQAMEQSSVLDYVPLSWKTMVQVKVEHLRALSHHYAALAFLDHCLESEEDEEHQRKLLDQLHVSDTSWLPPEGLLRNKEECKKLGKAHLRRAVLLHEEALRVHMFCKPLRRLDVLQEVLTFSHNHSLTKYSDLDEEDNFIDIDEVPNIAAKSQQKLQLTLPNFTNVKAMDLFLALGPLPTFSARNRWSAPRSVILTPCEDGFGLMLRGDAPVKVAGVEDGGVAERAGVRAGDCIVDMCGRDARWARHDDVVGTMLGAGDEGVQIRLISLLPPKPLEVLEHRKGSGLGSGRGTFPLSSSLSSSPNHGAGGAGGAGTASGRLEQASRSRGLLTLGWFTGRKAVKHNTLPSSCLGIKTVDENS